MINKSLINFLFAVLPTVVFAQGLSGTVVSGVTRVANASVTLSKDDRVLDFTFTDTDGNFRFKSVGHQNIEIRVSHLNYQTKNVLIGDLPQTSITIQLSEKETELEEVTVVNEQPIRQKKDTVVYNLKHFADGTEKVVEDLLRKLPGMTVNDDGKIFFKNKEIESLMIDGDDLFSSRYTIGSKNISAEDVESVEAIENFNKNQILHQITESNQVALNLKLKKNRPVLTTRVDLGNDFHSKYDNSITTLLLDARFKGFNVSRINNLGTIHSAGLLEFSDQKNYQRRSSLIDEGIFPQFLGEQNSLLNRSFSTDNSAKVTLSKKTSSTFGISYYNDKLSQNFVNSTRYRFEDADFTYTNTDDQQKDSGLFSVRNHTQYYNESNFQFNSELLLESRKSIFESDATNNNLVLKNKVDGDNLYMVGRTEGTYKLSERAAFKFRTTLSWEHLRQRFVLNPAIEVSESFSANEQTANIRSDFYEVQAEYYNSWNKLKLKISNTLDGRSDEMLTQLKADQEQIQSGFVNDLTFNSLANQFATELRYGINKFKIGVSNSLWYSKASMSEEGGQNLSYLYRFEVKYAVAKKQSLEFLSSKSIQRPLLENVFKAPVLTSYRNISSNEGNLDYINLTESSIAYIISDFYNTFYLRAAIVYTRKGKDYYSTLDISPVLTSRRYILLERSTDRTGFMFNIHKLIPFIKLNFKYNGSYSNATFYNLIEDGLRSIRATDVTNEIILNKSLAKGLTVQNKIRIQSQFYKSDGQNNSFSQLKNEFKVNYKISKALSLESNYQYIVPDTQKGERYHFIGFEAIYELPRPRCEIYLSGQNLINHKTFNSVDVSDYAVSSFSYRLQERNILLGLRFKLF